MKKLTVLLVAGVACAAAFGDVPGTIKTTTGETQKGNIRWSTREKAYVVTKGNIELQVKESDVDVLDIDKPASFDAAVEQVQKGQGAAAIPALQKITKDYQHLQWDKVAGRYLADAYIAASKAEDALKTCQNIISGEPAAAYKGELAPAYWKALLALGLLQRLGADPARRRHSQGRQRIRRRGEAGPYGRLPPRGIPLQRPGGCLQAAARGSLQGGALLREARPERPCGRYAYDFEEEVRL